MEKWVIFLVPIRKTNVKEIARLRQRGILKITHALAWLISLIVQEDVYIRQTACSDSTSSAAACVMHMNLGR